jgi:hypothetical protein
MRQEEQLLRALCGDAAPRAKSGTLAHPSNEHGTDGERVLS